jgi:nucleotide-binding universal stress UspA family protein
MIGCAETSQAASVSTNARDDRLAAVHRVLCAVDLTSDADIAVQRASLLAGQMGSELRFVHAVEDSRSERMLRMRTALAQARLLSLADRVATEGAARPAVSVKVGSTIHAIAAAADEWQPDLIVMGRPRRQRFELLIGTTAERIIRATHCPLLIANGNGRTAYRKVVLATDLSATSVHVTRTAVKMGLLDDAYTWIVHAFNPPHSGLLPADVEGQLAAHRQHWRGVMSKDLLQKLSDEGIDAARVEVIVEAARPFDAIEQSLEIARPELLVIGTSRWFMLKRLLFGSVADKVLRRVACDVLAISPVVKESRSAQRAFEHPVEHDRVQANVPRLPLQQSGAAARQ